MSITTKKEKKQSKGPAGMTEEELKDLKTKKRLKSMRTAKPASRTYTPRGMEMGPDLRSDEQKMKDAIDSLLAKGGEVKKLKGGGLAEATAKRFWSEQKNIMSYQSANAHTSDWFGCMAARAA